jgi:quinol monooxygenase YgiN
MVSFLPLMVPSRGEVGFSAPGIRQRSPQEVITMKTGLLVRIEAEPEYADQVEAALRGAQELAEQERLTVTWFAFRQDATTFGVFDTFHDEQGRQSHLQGPIAAALGEMAQTMLSSTPVVTQVDLLGVKVP